MTISVILALLGYFIFSAAVGAMATPTPDQERAFYGWLYRFLQRLAANADRVAAARFGLTANGTSAPGQLVAVTHERDTAVAVNPDQDVSPGRDPDPDTHTGR